MSVEEYEIDKAALERMLADFEADYLRGHKARLYLRTSALVPCLGAAFCSKWRPWACMQ